MYAVIATIVSSAFLVPLAVSLILGITVIPVALTALWAAPERSERALTVLKVLLRALRHIVGRHRGGRS